MMPSKISGILAAGRPVMFLGDPEGEAAAGLARDGTGVVLDLHRPERWRDEVAALRADPARAEAMASRARRLGTARGPGRPIGLWRSLLEEVLEPASGTSLAPVGVIAQAAGRRYATIDNT